MDGDNNWDCNHVRLQLSASADTLAGSCTRSEVSAAHMQAYFKPRSGGTVTLYIDSHVEPNSTPVVKLPGGGTYSQSSLWTDLYSAMREAKHIIYIAGARCLIA